MQGGYLEGGKILDRHRPKRAVPATTEEDPDSGILIA